MAHCNTILNQLLTLIPRHRREERNLTKQGKAKRFGSENGNKKSGWKYPVKFCKIILGDRPGHSAV